MLRRGSLARSLVTKGAIAAPVALVAGAVFAGTTPEPQQDRFADVKIKTTHVAGSIHMMEGAGGNLGVSQGPDGMLLIDDQFAELADRIRAAISDLGDEPLRFVVNTHFHGDHTGSNAALGQDATIVAHHNVRRRLAEADPAPESSALPDITYGRGLTLHVNGEAVQITHYARCHTDGDSIVFFPKSNVAHLGDLFFSGRFPYIDTASGGDVENYIEAIEALCESLPEDVQLIPGHGPLSTMEDLRNYRDMLTETRALVGAARTQGKTVEQCQAAGLPPKWRAWAWNFIPIERWVDVLYRSFDD